MGYRTVDEFEHFDFKDAEILEIYEKNGHIFLSFAFVTIKGDNSCNRDIRDMGTQELLLKLMGIRESTWIREGFKRYDADGNLQETCEDETIPPEELSSCYQQLKGAVVYDAKKDGEQYSFIIDTEERTFQYQVSAEHDTEEWERFMNKNQ